MNLKEIKDAVKYIDAIKGDDEAAHSKEDALYHDFIRELSKRKDRVGAFAKEIIKTEKIQFSRWCA